MGSATIDRRLRSARVAVFSAFTLNGFLLAMWVVHIPAITDRAGVSASTLGTFVLLLAAAALVGMRLAGPVADRIGSRTLVAIAATAASLTVLGPGLATSPLALGVALACFGFGNGALDVSMNTQAVHVERAYRRPIMSAFHAMFSAGGFAGALVGAAAQRAGWSPPLTLACASIAGLLCTALLVPRLVVHHEPASRREDHGVPTAGSAAEASVGKPGAHEVRAEGGAVEVRPGPTGPDHRLAHVRRRNVLSLGVIAFVLLLAEGVAADWSALQAREHLGASESGAALAFGAFSATMTIGRFLTDRVSQAFGPVAIVRYGSLLAAAGFTVVIVSPWLPLTLAGWAMCGLGIAGGVPQIFSTAGNLGGSTAATDMSRVFTIGYLGLLAGPAMIGWLTALIPLTAALAVPLVLTLACAAAARVVSR